MQSLNSSKAKSVLLTTHHLDEAENISDYIYIIAGGNIKAHGTISELKSRLGVGDKINVKRKVDRSNKEVEYLTENMISSGHLSSFIAETQNKYDLSELTCT